MCLLQLQFHKGHQLTQTPSLLSHVPSSASVLGDFLYPFPGDRLFLCTEKTGRL